MKPRFTIAALLVLQLLVGVGLYVLNPRINTFGVNAKPRGSQYHHVYYVWVHTDCAGVWMGHERNPRVLRWRDEP